MSNKPKLSHRFIATMTIVSCVLVTLFILLVVVVEDQLEVIGLNHWLDVEADRYFNYVDSEEPYVPNPDEFNYYVSNGKLPVWLTNYSSTGFYEHELGPDDRHFLVREFKDTNHLFYLVFKKDADDYFDAYESNLIKFTVSLSVAFLLLMVFFSVFLVRLIVKPFNQLNKKIDKLAPNGPDFIRDAQYQEFQVIEDALHESKKRIEQYFKREQEFSRFAAHEIRTPLMVLKGSSELLNHLNHEHPLIKKAAKRISIASDDISILTNTFLLLGKEQIDSSFYRQVDMHAIVTQCLDDAERLFPERQLVIGSTLEKQAYVNAPPDFVKVLVNNLVKNSFTYVSEKKPTDLDKNDIAVVLTPQTLSISNRFDSGEIKSGYGYGLVIVERICQRLHWDMQMEKKRTQFSISIQFSK